MLSGMHVVTGYIVEDSCASLGPSIRSFVEHFCVVLDELVIEAFRAGSIAFQFHADAFIDKITVRF